MKDTKIELRVTSDQKKAISLYANKDGRTVTGFILHTVLSAIERKAALSCTPSFEEVLARDKRTEEQRRYQTPTAFEEAWYRGATLEEAIAFAAAKEAK